VSIRLSLGDNPCISTSETDLHSQPWYPLPTEVEKTTLDTLSGVQKQSYRFGGVAALVLGVGYIIIIPLYAHVGAPPSGGEAWFKYLPGKTTGWWAILGLCVFTDYLYVPVALARTWR
jgi:hypothetical protein